MKPSRDPNCQRYVDSPDHEWFWGAWRTVEGAVRERQRHLERTSTPGRCAVRGCEEPRQPFDTGNYARLCADHKSSYGSSRRCLDLQSIRNAEKSIARCKEKRAAMEARRPFSFTWVPA